MLKLQNISKVYRTTDVETRALEQVSFDVAAGEFVAIMGPFRLRQVDAAQHPGAARRPVERRLLSSSARTSRAPPRSGSPSCGARRSDSSFRAST